MPEGSPHTEEDKDADRPASEGGDANDNSEEEEEEPPTGDIVIKEEYYEEQEEELDYEDDAPNEECEQVVEVNESEQAANMEEKQPTIWSWLGDPIERAPIPKLVRQLASWNPFWDSRVRKMDVEPMKGMLPCVAIAVITNTPY